MKAQTQSSNKKKSMMITGFVHAALLLIGLIPLTSAIQQAAVEHEYIIPIEFAEFAQSSDEGLLATSEVVEEEIKPVVEQETEEVDVVEEETIEEVSQQSEVVEEIESDVVEESVEEVAAAETEVESTDEETSAEAGQNATAEEGETQGNDVAGNDEGQNGLDGDGVITRKIIHRTNISEAAYESGQIVVDVCIDRRGRILTAANNADSTTIGDMNMVRDVLNLVAEYKFETDYSAALRECGRITFVFDIERESELWSEEISTIAMNE